jgi:hypothetical protein
MGEVVESNELPLMLKFINPHPAAPHPCSPAQIPFNYNFKCDKQSSLLSIRSQGTRVEVGSELCCVGSELFLLLVLLLLFLQFEEEEENHPYEEAKEPSWHFVRGQPKNSRQRTQRQRAHQHQQQRVPLHERLPQRALPLPAAARMSAASSCVNR